MPKRVQRKRERGWKMPENTVYVGRPTKWGNPFKVGGIGLDGKPQTVSDVLFKFKKMIEGNRWTSPNSQEIKNELKGKDLACWCKEGQPCHADILLEIANN